MSTSTGFLVKRVAGYWGGAPSALIFRLMMICLVVLSLTFALPASAQESFCAQVTIEIKQELTLERQGFDAFMRINNGLPDVPVEDVHIVVAFTDEDGNPVQATSDPENTDAAFFIRLDSLSGIGNVDGRSVWMA